jgi:hypothetical protein
VILAQREDARLFHREMLLEGNLDGAAAVLIEQLRSPIERGETLASLQDMRTYPSLPGDVRIDAAWRALKRADVRPRWHASAASSATTWSAPPPRAERLCVEPSRCSAAWRSRASARLYTTSGSTVR